MIFIDVENESKKFLSLLDVGFFFLDRDFEVFGSISVSVYFLHEQIKGNMLALSELQILISKT